MNDPAASAFMIKYLCTSICSYATTAATKPHSHKKKIKIDKYIIFLSLCFLTQVDHRCDYRNYKDYNNKTSVVV